MNATLLEATLLEATLYWGYYVRGYFVPGPFQIPRATPKKKETVSEKVETLKTDQKTRTTTLLRKDPQDVST